MSKASDRITLIVGWGIIDLMFPVIGTIYWRIGWVNNRAAELIKATNPDMSRDKAVIKKTLKDNPWIKRDVFLQWLAGNIVWFTVATLIILLSLMLAHVFPPFAFLGFGSAGALAIMASLGFVALASLAVIAIVLIPHSRLGYVIDIPFDILLNKKLKFTVYAALVLTFILCTQFGFGVFAIPAVGGIAPLALTILIIAAFTVAYVVLERGVAMLVKALLMVFTSPLAAVSSGPVPTPTWKQITTILMTVVLDQVMGDRPLSDEATDSGLTQKILYGDNHPPLSLMFRSHGENWQAFKDQAVIRSSSDLLGDDHNTLATVESLVSTFVA